MHPGNICIVEFRLDSYTGHMFNYDHSIYQAARSLNFKVRVLGGRNHLPEIAAALPVEPVFDTSFRPTETGSRVINFFLKPLQSNWVVYRALCSVDRGALTRDWIVFVGDAATWNLTGLALWLGKFPAENAPTFVLCLRYSYCHDDKRSRAAFWLFPGLRMLERLSARYRIRLVSDSERLAEEYKKFTKLPVAVLPIPHTDYAVRSTQPEKNGIEILSLGDARNNKGFDLLAKAIKLLYERRALEGIRFTLQCHILPDPWHKIRVFVEMLRNLKLPDLKLVEETVDEERYRRMLRGAGAVALPYRKADYSGNTSGIFTEALAAGKPVIVTTGTWMEDQLNRFGAGVTFRDGDVPDLARAILELRDNYPRLSAQAQERRGAWTAYHSPGNFVRELIKVADSPGRGVKP